MRLTPILAVLFLAACRDDRPPAPTAEESDQLNEAEGMLNNIEEAAPTQEQAGHRP